MDKPKIIIIGAGGVGKRTLMKAIADHVETDCFAVFEPNKIDVVDQLKEPKSYVIKETDLLPEIEFNEFTHKSKFHK